MRLSGEMERQAAESLKDKRMKPADGRTERSGPRVSSLDSSPGGSLSRETLLELQRLYGNQYVNQLLRSSKGMGGGAGGAAGGGPTGEMKREAPAPPAKTESKEKGPGFLSRVGHGLAHAGEWLWGGVKAAGRGIAAAGSAVWSALKWVGSRVVSKVEGIFLRVARWVEKLPTRVARLFSGLWHGVLSLRPWALDWWESLGHARTWLDFLKWLGARAVDVLEILGIGEIYETVMELVKFNTRALTETERNVASTVFGASIRYELVRVDQRAAVGPAFSHREYTSFHTINGWGAIKPETLIHELTHVWQYEHAGAIYMPQAIHAQVWGGGYEYGAAAGLQTARTAGKGLLTFNREQQAQIVEDFYLLKTGGLVTGASASDLPLYAHFVREVSTLTEAQLLAR